MSPTPRERLRTTLARREPDRPPFDLGSSQVTSIAVTDPIVASLSGPHVESIREASERTLREFVTEQRAMLSRVAAEAAAGNSEGADAILSASGAAEKRAQLQQAMATLTRLAA